MKEQQQASKQRHQWGASHSYDILRGGLLAYYTPYYCMHTTRYSLARRIIIFITCNSRSHVIINPIRVIYYCVYYVLTKLVCITLLYYLIRDVIRYYGCITKVLLCDNKYVCNISLMLLFLIKTIFIT
jgi:hypothetical protein